MIKFNVSFTPYILLFIYFFTYHYRYISMTITIFPIEKKNQKIRATQSYTSSLGYEYFFFFFFLQITNSFAHSLIFFYYYYFFFILMTFVNDNWRQLILIVIRRYDRACILWFSKAVSFSCREIQARRFWRKPINALAMEFETARTII